MLREFRPKKLNIGMGGFVNARIIRDHNKRMAVEQTEPERYATVLSFLGSLAWWNAIPLAGWNSSPYLQRLRIERIGVANALSHRNRQALRYIIRNTTLPQRVRAQAQLQLAQMHPYTRPTQIKNRCINSGHARSVLRDFRLNRVSSNLEGLAFLSWPGPS